MCSILTHILAIIHEELSVSSLLNHRVSVIIYNCYSYDHDL